MRTGRTWGWRPALTIAFATATVGLVATGCGSSDSSNAGSSTSAASTAAATTASTPATESTDPGLAQATKLVEDNSKLATDFQAPGPPIEGARKALEGKTVWYVPIIANAAFFQGEANTLRDALSKVGASLKVCDGKINPSSVSACMTQAANSGAAGVITDAIPVQFAEQAYRKVTDAGIPVVASQLNLPIPTGGSFDKYLARNEGNELGAQQLAAANIIVDSGGKANVLMHIATDSPSAKLASLAAKEELEKNCPGCKVKTFEAVNTSPKIGTAFSSALLADPDADYVYAPYEAPTGELIVQGIKQTRRPVKLVMSAGDPAGLKRVAEGQQLSDSGTDPVAMGWNAVDTLLRLATGMPPTNMKTNIRLFTKDDVPTDLSEKARDSGEWYSDMSYKPMYEKLWNPEGTS